MVTPTDDSAKMKRERLAFRAARHICCNSPSVVETLRNTLTSVLDNIISNPEEVKYRSLRESNASVQSKLLSAHGAREILHLLGFEKIDDSISPYPEFRQYFLAEVDTEQIAEIKTWVIEQCDTALTMEGAQTQGSKACADCVVQVRLSSGQTLEGGFRKHERLGALYEFVRSCVLNPEEMLLLASPGYGEITQDKLDTTIEVRDEREDRMMLSYEAAGFIPRVKLAVVKNITSGKTGDELRRQRLQEDIEARKELNLVKQMHAHKMKETDNERERIMLQFQDDRLKQHSRDAASSKHGVQSVDGFEESKGY